MSVAAKVATLMLDGPCKMIFSEKSGKYMARNLLDKRWATITTLADAKDWVISEASRYLGMAIAEKSMDPGTGVSIINMALRAVRTEKGAVDTCNWYGYSDGYMEPAYLESNKYWNQCQYRRISLSEKDGECPVSDEWIESMYPIEDERRIIMAWIYQSWVQAGGDYKMTPMLVLVSGKDTGKSFFAEWMSWVGGATPSDPGVTADLGALISGQTRFTAQLASTFVWLLDDNPDDSRNRSDRGSMAKKLKKYVASKGVEIEAKGKDPVRMKASRCVIVCSNDDSASMMSSPLLTMANSEDKAVVMSPKKMSRCGFDTQGDGGFRALCSALHSELPTYLRKCRVAWDELRVHILDAEWNAEHCPRAEYRGAGYVPGFIAPSIRDIVEDECEYMQLIRAMISAEWFMYRSRSVVVEGEEERRHTTAWYNLLDKVANMMTGKDSLADNPNWGMDPRYSASVKAPIIRKVESLRRSFNATKFSHELDTARTKYPHLLLKERDKKKQRYYYTLTDEAFEEIEGDMG